MFGGKLCLSSFAFNQTGSYVVALGSKLCLFDETGKNVGHLFNAANKILAFCVGEDSSICVDQQGNITRFNESREVLYEAKVKSPISKALLLEGEIYFVSGHKLMYMTLGKKPKEVLKYQALNPINVLVLSQGLILFSEAQTLHIINHLEPTQIRTVKHNSEISSACVDGQNIVIGDVKGRITTYLNLKSNTMEIEGENNTISEHWHVHRVKALLPNGNILVSGGEEGVVVFWHRGVDKKDFLPRFGAEIQSLFMDEDCTRLACLLSDNTVRVVQLNNDNHTVILKQIVNPIGVKTKQTVEQPNRPKFPAGFHFNPSTKLICSNGLPGKLQFIDLTGEIIQSQSESTLEVIPRNWISRVDSAYPCPDEIVSVCFNPGWTFVVVATKSQHNMKLHFFEYNQSWKSVTVADLGLINQEQGLRALQCDQSIIHFSRVQDSMDRFITVFGGKIKVWAQILKKKQSMKGELERYWYCQGQLLHKGLSAKGASHYEASGQNIVVAVYENTVLLMNVTNKQIDKQLRISGVLTAHLVNKHRLLYKTTKQLCIYDCETRKSTFSLKSNIESYKLHQNSCAIIHSHNQKRVVSILDVSKNIITHNFQLNFALEGIFWALKNLYTVSGDLEIVGLITEQKIFEAKPGHDDEVESEEKQTSSTSIAQDICFAEHYRIESKRQTATVKHKITELLNDAKIYPTFVGSVSMIMGNLLL